MKSTSTSKRSVLKVENLTLEFTLQSYRAVSLRDLFVQLIHTPKKILRSPKRRLKVADKLSFEIFEGERVGLLGVNGTGKTSLCRCIAGTYKPDSGRIHVDGKMRAIFDIGLGIQPELTGRENAYLLSTFMFADHSNRQALVEEALKFSELGEFLDVPYRTYSSGMQARLSLSIVAAQACDFFILDEVFEGADQFFKEKISRRMLEVLQNSGAVLFVSHDPFQIERVCNRVIVLQEGQIAFDGPVAEGLRFYSSIGNVINFR